MKQYRINISTDLQSISDATQETSQKLTEWGINDEKRIQSILALEELLVKLAESADDDEKINIMLRKTLRSTHIRISCRGKQIVLSDRMFTTDMFDGEEEYGPEAADAIRDIVLNVFSDKIATKYQKGINTVLINIQKSDKTMLYDALTALGLALAVGLALRFALPEDIVSGISSNLFTPMYTMFIRAVQIIMAPLVFFSLASSICGLSDLSGLGRMGGKIMGLYLMTTFIAILLSIGIDGILQPGDIHNIVLPEASSTTIDAPEVDVSLKNTIINLVPNNFLGAFVKGDMLQVIVLSLLTGWACGKIGSYSASVKRGIEVMNSFFGSITAFIVKFLPFAIFGSVANMVTTIDVSTIGILGKWILTSLIAYTCMIGVYQLLILIFGRINPLHFISKYAQAFVTGLTSSSSSATMPVSIECCKKLGISSRIYSFSIPLGCTVNMDGTSICFTCVALFLARVYGIPLDGNTLFSLVVTIMLLSLAVPGVPGAGSACLLLVLGQIGVPSEALALVLGIVPLLELYSTAVNVTGDGAVTTIVAKSEKQLDLQQYRE